MKIEIPGHNLYLVLHSHRHGVSHHFFATPELVAKDDLLPFIEEVDEEDVVELVGPITIDDVRVMVPAEQGFIIVGYYRETGERFTEEYVAADANAAEDMAIEEHEDLVVVASFPRPEGEIKINCDRCYTESSKTLGG